MALQGKAYAALLDATKRVRSEEEQRKVRLRRIQQKEKELILLRSMPASDYFQLDKIRKDHALKVILRNVHRYAIKKYGVAKFGLVGTSERELDVKLNAQADILCKSMLDRCTKQGSQDGGKDTAMSKLISKIESDALGLAQLQRRIHDAARKRMKVLNKENERGDMFKKAVVGNNGSVDDFRASADLLATTKPNRRPTSGRAKIQKMMELQHTCAVWKSEYCDSKQFMHNMQNDRLKSLSHCKNLINQTKNLPSLDEAKAFLTDGKVSGDRDLKWLLDDDLNREGCEDAVKSHLRTLEVLTHSDKWNVIAPPHDLTGPPVDISSLPSVADHKGVSVGEIDLNEAANRQHRNMHHLASLWAAGADAEESLWWVSFASKLPEQHHVIDDEFKIFEKIEIKMGQPPLDSDKARVQKMLGAVDGHALLLEASKDFLRAKDRRSIVARQVQKQRAKEIRIAHILEEEALEVRKRLKATTALEQHTKYELEKRHIAARKIQALLRGHSSRKATATLISEVRMLDAIRVLLGELQGSNDNNRNGAAGGSGYAGAGAINKIGNLRNFLARTKANEVDFTTHNTPHRPRSPISTHRSTKHLSAVASSPTMAMKATADVVRFQDVLQSKSQYKSTPRSTATGTLMRSPFVNANVRHAHTENNEGSTDLYLAQPKAEDRNENEFSKATPLAFGKSMPGISSFAEVGMSSFLHESVEGQAALATMPYTTSTADGPSGFISPPTRSSATNLDISAFSDEISQSKLGSTSPTCHFAGFSKATPTENYNNITLDESTILGHDGAVIDSVDSKLPEFDLRDSPLRAQVATRGGGGKVTSTHRAVDTIGIEGVGMVAFEDDMKVQQQYRYR